jgi:hypothetical protein
MALSLGRSLALAFALHALGLALLAKAPERDERSRLAGSAETAPTEIEIDLRALPRPTAGLVEDDRATQTRAGSPIERTDAVASLGRSLRTATDDEPEPSAADDPAGVESAVPAPFTLPEPPAPGRLSLEQLGVGSATALLDAPPRATRKRRAGASVAPGVDRSMREELAQKDSKLGFGAHGPVIAALERWTRAGATPENASAVFLAQVDEKGRLVRVGVLEASEAYAAWSAVADRTFAALRKRKLSVPAGARGVAMQIRVESRVQMPSGADPGLGVRALGIPLKRGEGKRSAQIDILTPQVDVEMVDSPLPGQAGVKLPVVSLGVPVLGVVGDPVDIGAKRLRIVRARVVSQSLL